MKKLPQLSSGETIYLYAIKELLTKLKLNKPTIVIDGVTNKKYIQFARTYLRKALRQHGVEKCKIGFVDSRKDVVVQLADIIVGSIARSYNKNKPDHSDYLQLLETKIKWIKEIGS